MMAKVFTVLALSFVVGSCSEVTQRFSGQSISIPVSSESSSFYSTPELSDNVLACRPSLSTPVASENVFSSEPFFSAPVASAPGLSDDIFTSGPTSFSPVASDNILPIGSPASVPSSNNLFSPSFRPVAVQAINEPHFTSAVLPVAEKSIAGVPITDGQVTNLLPRQEPEPIVTTKCICTKTFIRSQIYQRTVIVPKIQRYLKRTFTPVVETIAYKSKPKLVSSVPSSVALSSSDDSTDYQPRYSSYAPVVESSRLISPSTSFPFSKIC